MRFGCHDSEDLPPASLAVVATPYPRGMYCRCAATPDPGERLKFEARSPAASTPLNPNILPTPQTGDALGPFLFGNCRPKKQATHPTHPRAKPCTWRPEGAGTKAPKTYHDYVPILLFIALRCIMLLETFCNNNDAHDMW